MFKRFWVVALLLGAAACRAEAKDALLEKAELYAKEHPDEWFCPKPGYPSGSYRQKHALVIAHYVGGRQGKIESVQIIQSSRSPLLDRYISFFILKYWRCPTKKVARPLEHTTTFDFGPRAYPRIVEIH